MITPLAQKKNIVLTSDIPDDLPEVPIDRERMTFAIQNLLDNAIKYTKDAGTVAFSARIENDALVIRVTDSGIGISSEDQGRLFERFFRARKATEMVTDGSGLGLAIAKGIITVHGGTISIESKEDRGSTFTITLPLHNLPSPSMEE